MRITDGDIRKTWALQGTLNFTRYFFKTAYKRKFVVGQHHIAIANALDKVLQGEIKRLIINIAPRYGKTELAVKQFIAMGLAVNPQAKFIHLSYSDDLVRDNSKGVQDIVRMPEYQALFPGTMPTTTNSRKWFTESGGGLYAVSSAGQVTGFGAGLVDKEEKDLEEALTDITAAVSSADTFGGAIVIDDPIKPDDARSDLIREKVNQKFETTIRNRVNSRNTPIVIIMQRLDENDLCGYLMNLERESWEVLSLPVLYTDENGDEQALWPFKHTVEELHALRDTNSWVFDTQYMQNPKPLEGLMYTTFRTYEVYNRGNGTIKAYVDTADTGADYLCAIVYFEADDGNYLLDVLFTQKPMEYTEPATAEMLTKHNVAECVIESNNGGRGFARNVERNCRELGNNSTRFKWFHQAENKQVRIFTKSNEVQNLTFYPVGWERLWPEFAQSIKGYMKNGRNAHDDAPDALTGTVEKRGTKRQTNIGGFFY